MRLLGTFVNFGSASDHLYWQGHVMRTAWRKRRRLEVTDAAETRPAAPAPGREAVVGFVAGSATPCAR